LLTQQSPLFRYDYSDGKKTNQAIGSAAIYDIVARLVQNSGIQRVKKGLGLIHDDVDIHELHLVKDFVDTDDDQGLDIEIYKYDDKTK
jgi:hypothetical protein